MGKWHGKVIAAVGLVVAGLYALFKAWISEQVLKLLRAYVPAHTSEALLSFFADYGPPILLFSLAVVSLLGFGDKWHVQWRWPYLVRLKSPKNPEIQPLRLENSKNPEIQPHPAIRAQTLLARKAKLDREIAELTRFLGHVQQKYSKLGDWRQSLDVGRRETRMEIAAQPPTIVFLADAMKQAAEYLRDAGLGEMEVPVFEVPDEMVRDFRRPGETMFLRDDNPHYMARLEAYLKKGGRFIGAYSDIINGKKAEVRRTEDEIRQAQNELLNLEN